MIKKNGKADYNSDPQRYKKKKNEDSWKQLYFHFSFLGKKKEFMRKEKLRTKIYEYYYCC